MTLPRDEIVKGIQDELAEFSALVRSLDGSQWNAPSRCEGWTAADIAAHVTGGLADVVAGRFDGLGTPEVTERQVAERRGRSQSELADELDTVAAGAAQLLAAFDDDSWNGPAPAGVASSVGAGVETLWYDAYLHADDIRTAAGLPTVVGDGVRAAVSHIAEALTNQGWGPATLALEGIERFEVGGGGDRTITCDPMTFVLAATGRLDPATIGLDESVNIYR